MKPFIISILCYFFSILTVARAQDTFSMVAIDTTTGEVGSAGASCVDLTGISGLSDHFLGELFPGKGAINTQAYYVPANQINARNRMNAGDTPSQIIDWLIENDISNQPQLRQYGIVAMVTGSPQSAGYTGAGTDDYKNHITGPHYAIQGNILLGQEILDSMEARFLAAEGSLACRLMAALQGANVVGADTRCASNGTSSLFAFVKVAQPDDDFGNPSFIRSVRTKANAGIEPIDSLQIIFDNTVDCGTTGLGDGTEPIPGLTLSPNPTGNALHLWTSSAESYQMELRDLTGRLLHTGILLRQADLDMTPLPAGTYLLRLWNEKASAIHRVVRE
ncbi:MAG: DUF1028 domain-containing protein [Saprospiraceae bacterium]|nr:DUF1028 domain-containing protein [Saprospiraceae bacterium]MCB9311928.1 DUF1028 domain-containing protein [Lewinellaceae bacterium]HRW74350.1 DUF1028 domain-containing protein [Saprospiraceae bacterium]